MNVHENPTFGLVHGAWHGAWCWEKVTAELDQRGYEAVAVDLPIDDPTSTFEDHADIVASELQGRERVVLVGHSRGGNVIPRAAGRMAVDRLIYVCGAFHATLPEQQLQAAGNIPPSAMPDFSAGIVPIGNNLAAYDPQQARNIFYQDCTDEDAAWAISRLRPQRRAPEVRMNDWPNVPADYILCREDQVINPDWSRFAARQWLGTKAVELPGGHSPFLSRPALLAATLISLAEG